MKKLYNINELSEQIGVSRSQIYNLIKKGLPIIKVGYNTRFDIEEVINWIKQKQ